MITVMAEEMRRWLIEVAAVYFFTMLLGTTALLLAAWFGRIYVKYHGSRTILCPETGASAVIRVDALHAAFSSVTGHPDVHLQHCSLWSERGECDQPCAKQLKP